MPITHVPPGVPYEIHGIDERPVLFHRDANGRTVNEAAAVTCFIMAMKSGLVVGVATYLVFALAVAFGFVK